MANRTVTWEDLTCAEQERLAEQVAAMRGVTVNEARALLSTKSGGDGS